MTDVAKGRRRFLTLTTGGAVMLSQARLAALAAVAATGSRYADAAQTDTRPMASDSALRVVVIGGAVCECVYALDAGASLVGADITCRFPAAAGALPKIGYERSLSAEGILSLHPDLVLHSGDAGPPAALKQVQDAGVRVVGMPGRHDVDNVRAMIGLTARALDVAPRGAALLARFDAQWRDAESTVRQAAQGAVDGAGRSAERRAESTQARSAERPVRAVFVMSNGGSPPMLAGSHTAAAAMLHLAGAENAISGFSGYRAATPEALLVAAPDVVVTTDDALASAGGVQRFLAQPGFAQTPAARAQRVIAYDTLFLLGFGPRLPQAVVALAEGLHRV
jgi:iron complex transport system substrate-binding protein